MLYMPVENKHGARNRTKNEFEEPFEKYDFFITIITLAR